MFSVEFSPFLAGILSPEICLGGFGSSDVSRSSLVFLKKEILTPKSLRESPMASARILSNSLL